MNIEIYGSSSEGEEWKWIKGYEGLYQISSLGRIKSFRKNPNGYILSISNQYGGYLTMNLFDAERNRKTRRIHLLVAEAFIGEIPQGYEVHHKNGNKQNNSVSNLEIIKSIDHRRLTMQEHPEYAKGMNYYNQYIRPKRIMQFSKGGELIGVYANAQIASRMTGICARNIHQVASKTPFNEKGNIRKQAGGYIWRFAEESEVMMCED